MGVQRFGAEEQIREQYGITKDKRGRAEKLLGRQDELDAIDYVVKRYNFTPEEAKQFVAAAFGVRSFGNGKAPTTKAELEQTRKYYESIYKMLDQQEAKLVSEINAKARTNLSGKFDAEKDAPELHSQLQAIRKDKAQLIQHYKQTLGVDFDIGDSGDNDSGVDFQISKATGDISKDGDTVKQIWASCNGDQEAFKESLVNWFVRSGLSKAQAEAYYPTALRHVSR